MFQVRRINKVIKRCRSKLIKCCLVTVLMVPAVSGVPVTNRTIVNAVQNSCVAVTMFQVA